MIHVTWVVFNIRLSYFIHRCRMWEEDTFTFFGPKVKVTNWTLSTLEFWHNNFSTNVVFNVQLPYFIHSCGMVRGRYLYSLWSKSHDHGDRLPCWALPDFVSFLCSVYSDLEERGPCPIVPFNKLESSNESLCRICSLKIWGKNLKTAYWQTPIPNHWWRFNRFWLSNKNLDSIKI